VMEKDDIRATWWGILCIAIPFITLYGLAIGWYVAFVGR
jgi:hypothetical protein